MRVTGEQSKALNEFIKENYKTMTSTKIAELFNTTDSAVRARAYTLGMVEKGDEARSKNRVVVEGNKTIHTCLG